MASPPHRANILNTTWDHAAVGVAAPGQPGVHRAGVHGRLLEIASRSVTAPGLAPSGRWRTRADHRGAARNQGYARQPRGGVAQLARALRSQRRGRRFESAHLHHSAALVSGRRQAGQGAPGLSPGLPTCARRCAPGRLSSGLPVEKDEHVSSRCSSPDEAFTIFSDGVHDVASANARSTGGDRGRHLPYAKQPVIQRASGTIIGYTWRRLCFVSTGRSPRWGWRLVPEMGAFGTHETAPILDQRHPRRLLRSPSGDPGRGAASLLGRRAGTSRCPSLWSGGLRDDGGSVAADGGGNVARLDG